MNEPKPFASLSSGLLARKGQAKPAMRPQGFASFGTPAAATGFDDLGWNDMGHDRTPAQIGLSPMDADIVPFNANAEPAFEPVEPVVFQQREDIERSFEAEAIEPVEEEERTGPVLMTKRKAVVAAPVVEPVVEAMVEPVAAPVAAPVFVAPASAFRAAPGTKSRAAFTLRLDQDRHLKLRLASAVTHRSAQMLVIEALDAFLANTPALAGITLPASAN